MPWRRANTDQTGISGTHLAVQQGGSQQGAVWDKAVRGAPRLGWGFDRPRLRCDWMWLTPPVHPSHGQPKTPEKARQTNLAKEVVAQAARRLNIEKGMVLALVCATRLGTDWPDWMN